MILSEFGEAVCFGIHDRKLTFLPFGTTWHRIRMGKGVTRLYVRINKKPEIITDERGNVITRIYFDGCADEVRFEQWVLQPRGDGYMAPLFCQQRTVR